jgi:hypothetical protein
MTTFRAVLVAAILGVLATAAVAEWEKETIDSGEVGLYPAIAVDPDGGVHVSYYASGDGDLKVATKAGGPWSVAVVDSEGNVGTHTSIAVDGFPAPHVAYRDETNDYVKYAWFDTTQWHTDVFDDGGGNGFYTAIAVNPDTDALYIEYLNSFTQVLHVVVCTPDCVYEVATDAPVSEGGSMARGAGDVLWVPYHDAGDDGLYMTYRENEIWHAEEIDTDGNNGRAHAVAVDSQGHPHVAYYAFDDGDVRYATKGEGAWAVETVAGTDWVGSAVAIAVDTSDRPHVLYFNLTNSTIEHAVKSGEAWTTDVVGGNADGSCALASGADGSIHAVYRDTSKGGLIHARLVPSADDDDDTADDDTSDDDAADDAGDDDATGDDTIDDDAGGDDDNDGGCGDCGVAV